MKLSIGAARWCVALACAIGLVAAAASAPALVNNVTPRASKHQITQTRSVTHPLQTPAMRGFPYDWSHRHLIFSRPSSPAIGQRLERDPRYQIQQAWRARQARSGSVDDYMQALDAIATQLAAGAERKVLNPRSSQPLPRRRKIPLGAWGESFNVTVSNPNGNASYPAKFAFSSSTSCSDWVAFAVPVIGSAVQFNFFAFKNLYTATCTGGPTLKFAYAVAFVGGPLLTAPAISLAGDQVAFVESQPTATLDVVKFVDLTSAPTFPNPSPPAVLSTCGTAPCGKTITYDSSTTATLSAPFYDYGTGEDTAYVSDDNSTVWAINPVFTGAPAKKSGWGTGVVVNSSTPGKLTAPVFDSASQNVFVGDQFGNLYYVRTQSTSAGTCKGLKTGTPCLGDTPATLLCTGPGSPTSCCTAAKTGCNSLKVSATNRPIIEPVIVDSSTEKVFVFSNGNPNTGGSSVVQTDVTLSVTNVASIGAGTTSVIHEGTFDNNYFTDPTTGHLYVCGQNSSGIPQLYSFGFSNSPTSGTMSTSPAGGPIPLATAAAQCSPLTEDYNGTTDNLFLAVTTGCPASSASTSSGCVESYNITSGFPSFTTPPYSINFSQNASLGTSTGTGGIIIDNTTGTSNQMNIYFETEGTASACSKYSGGTTNNASCAVSLTQSSLQ